LSFSEWKIVERLLPALHFISRIREQKICGFGSAGGRGIAAGIFSLAWLGGIEQQRDCYQKNEYESCAEQKMAVFPAQLG